MCTLCLSDMGELRDEWLREPRPSPTDLATAREPEPAAPAPRILSNLITDHEAVAA